MDLGYAWAEVDVRRTADGRHVLLHDDTLDRTTNGRGGICASSLPLVRSLDAGSWFGDAFAGTTVPTLCEALDLARHHLGLYLDCRDVDAVQLVREVLDAGVGDGVMVIVPQEVHAVLRQEAAGRIPLVAYLDGKAAEIPDLVHRTGASIVEALVERTDTTVVETAHKVGAAMECVALGASDRREEWQRCCDLRVDWIMTDEPDELKRMLEARD